MAKTLKERREKLGWTQTDIAQELDENQPFVSKYESGERGIAVQELLEIARVLEADFCVLLRELDKVP